MFIYVRVEWQMGEMMFPFKLIEPSRQQRRIFVIALHLTLDVEMHHCWVPQPLLGILLLLELPHVIVLTIHLIEVLLELAKQLVQLGIHLTVMLRTAEFSWNCHLSEGCLLHSEARLVFYALFIGFLLLQQLQIFLQPVYIHHSILRLLIDCRQSSTRLRRQLRCNRLFLVLLQERV